MTQRKGACMAPHVYNLQGLSGRSMGDLGIGQKDWLALRAEGSGSELPNPVGQRKKGLSNHGCSVGSDLQPRGYAAK